MEKQWREEGRETDIERRYMIDKTRETRYKGRKGGYHKHSKTSIALASSL